MRTFGTIFEVGPRPDFSDLDHFPPFRGSPYHAEITMCSPGGLPIIESALAMKVIEDWSRVRSKGRARRRLAMGHRQNIVRCEEPCAYSVGGVMYAHPVIFAELKKRFSADIEKTMERATMDAIMGRPVQW